ncbi:MmpS family transport accessory protein [Mycobacterium syngnathidarum]
MLVLKRVWMPVLIGLLVISASFSVGRLRTFFGSEDLTRPGSGLVNARQALNPKVVRYEVLGSAGATATINYLDQESEPQHVMNTTLPWAMELTTDAPATSAHIVAQGDGDSIACRITINGVVKNENISTGVNAQTFCLVTGA